jgi:hypothetical protein
MSANSANVAKNNKGFLSKIGNVFGASAPVNTPVAPVNVANAPVPVAPTNNGQLGGARRRGRSALRIPSISNVLRVTSNSVRKIRNVGVFGIKKVGNVGVYGIKKVGNGVKAIGSVTRSLTKRRSTKRKTAKRRN